MTGRVFDIKKFALHDGPGIRTTLFPKGCPLNCIWCHNPEGIRNEVHLWYFENSCIRCRSCIEACPVHALSVSEESSPFIRIDRNLCNTCGICTETCPTNALSLDSSDMTADEAVAKLLQDREFYTQSGGGITISGGDPLFQHEFALEVLRSCREEQVHTAIETSMQTDWTILERFLRYVDLFIVDIKIYDPVMHRTYTGKNNTRILENFRLLARSGAELLVRIPLIPGITATEENLGDIARFVRGEAPEVPIELINFNPLASNKYRLMGLEHTALKQMEPFSEGRLAEFLRVVEEEGVPVIGEAGSV